MAKESGEAVVEEEEMSIGEEVAFERGWDSGYRRGLQQGIRETREEMRRDVAHWIYEQGKIEGQEEEFPGAMQLWRMDDLRDKWLRDMG